MGNIEFEVMPGCQLLVISHFNLNLNYNYDDKNLLLITAGILLGTYSVKALQIDSHPEN